MSTRPALVAALVAAVVFITTSLGCLVDTTIGDDLQLSCAGDGECPSGRRCVEGRCLTDAQVAQAVAFVDAPAFVAGEDVRSDHEGQNTFHITATLNEEAVLAASAEVGDVPCVEADGHAWTCTGVVLNATAEGIVGVLVTATDAVGRTAEKQLSLTVDKTAPAPSIVNTDIARDGAPRATAGDGSIVVLTLAFDEAAAAVTVVGAPVTGGGSEEFTVEAAAGGTLATATLDVAAATTAPGERSVRVTTTDAVGNVATVELAGAFTVDFDAPSAPAVDVADAVVYRRAPWGTDGAAPSFRLEGAAGAADATASDVVVTADADGLAVLATLPVGADGSFASNLAIGDLPELFVHCADAAGNVSPIVRVRDGVWIATPTRPAGSPPNPTRVDATAHLDAALFDDAMTAVDAAALGATGDGATIAVSAVGDWRQLSFGTRPRPRARASAAYDEARDTVVLFGGDDGGVALDETWTFTANAWSQRAPAHRPPARLDAAMAYDVGGDGTVLFGGTGGTGGLLGDTWIWDGTDWTPVATAAGEAPSARSGARMTGDASGRRVLLFGGEDAAGFRADTWIFDVVTRRWTEVLGGAAPPPRARAALTTAAAPLLFGGEDAGGARSDTWTFDGAAWNQTATTGAAPAAQAGASLVARADGDPLLVATDAGGTQTELFRFVGGQWSVYAPDSAPGARAFATAAAIGTRLLVFSGVGPGNQPIDETLIFDDVTGHVAGHVGALSVSTPPALQGVSMARDVPNDRVLLVGLDAGRQTWAFNSASWTPAGLDGGSAGALAADAALDVVQVSSAGGVEIFSNGAWQPLVAAGQIGFGGGLAAGFDGAHVVGAGADLGFLSGATWTQAADPGARTDAAIAFDGAGAVLFGGSAGVCTPTCDDTWVFDGSAWQQVNGAAPPARSAHAIAYDEARDEAVLFGGLTDTGALADTWAFSAGQWRELNPAHAPPARFGHALASVDGGVVLFGGLVGIAAQNDTWVWRGGGADSPAQIIRAPFAAAGVDGAVVVSIDVSVVSGSAAHAAGTGVDLRVWQRAAWATVSTGTGTGSGLGTVSAALDSASLIGASLIGNDQTLHCAVVEAGAAGPFTGADDLVTDAAFLSFHYRLP